MLVRRVKAYHTNELDIYKADDNFSESKIIISSIIEESLKFVSQKIDNHYISSGKLTREDATIVLKSFESIAVDMENGKINDSLYSYLKDNHPDLTKELFYSKYHHVMNYLLLLFKHNISQEIKST